MRRMFSIPLVVLLSLLVYRAPALTGSGILDPDYYWHLQYGDWILNHGSLPTADMWSWTVEGKAYKLTQWLGELVMAVANRIGGEHGTSALAALLVTATMACSYKAARCYLDNRLAALAAAVGCNAILVSLSCRPHQFTHLGLACLTWIVARYMSTGDKKSLYWLPLLFALWVNLHGGYAVGLVYLWMMVGTIAADKFIINRCDEIVSACSVLGIAALVATLATLINPYGWGAWQYAIQIANLKSSSAGIVDEWAATTIKGDVGFNHFMVTAAMFACMIASIKRPPVGALLTAIALAAAGWFAIRVSLMMTTLMVPVLAAWLRHTPFYAVVFDGVSRRFDRLIPPSIACLLVGLVLAGSIWSPRVDTTARQYVTANFPERELAFIQTKHLEGRLLNTPETGGYLIREGAKHVALDTRLDLYGDKALFENILASKGATGWKAYLQTLDPDILLVSNNAALRQLATESGDFRTVFIGQRYSVMIKSGARADLETVVPVTNEALLSQLKS